MKTKARDVIASFYKEAYDLLPLLGKKPHFIVLPRMEFDYHWLDDTATGPGLISKHYENITRWARGSVHVVE